MISLIKTLIKWYFSSALLLHQLHGSCVYLLKKNDVHSGCKCLLLRVEVCLWNSVTEGGFGLHVKESED